MTFPVAHIIDDDPDVCDALTWLLKSRGVSSLTWTSPEAFLQADVAQLQGCMLLDVRMPVMSGIELFDRARKMGCRLPVIFLTGHGDVPMAVEAIKNGACDFLEKPYDDNALVDKVLAAMRIDAESKQRDGSLELLRAQLTQLTQREQEVMREILSGKLNKVIADELGIAMRTVEVHRARIFEKMQVRSAVELSQRLKALDAPGSLG
jgi:two-component system response regulator DctR